MQTPEEFEWSLYESMNHQMDEWKDQGEVHALIRDRDAGVRAETLAQAERADPILRAWVEPGINPPYHERMKARVRKIMPTLARHLDEKAKDVR